MTSCCPASNKGFRVFTGPLSCMRTAIETEKELLEENEENLGDTHPLILITYSLY